MKLFFVISLLICVSYVYSDCPARSELHCNFYDTPCQPGYSKRNTYIVYNGKRCDACRICYPDSAHGICPQVQCPYDNIQQMYPMDCGIFLYPQKTMIDGLDCDACETFTKDCSDLSWIGR